MVSSSSSSILARKELVLGSSAKMDYYCFIDLGAIVVVALVSTAVNCRKVVVVVVDLVSAVN